jgi:glycosyltransferase involved in cell wall biosynthesis
LKVQLIAYSDARDGASRAMSRLHQALQQTGHDATALVRLKQGDEAAVSGPTGISSRLLNKLRMPVGLQLLKLQRPTDENFRSLNALPSLLANTVNGSDAEIVNLHWVGGETLSIEDIGRIRKPLVWTLHDMWPFCGAEHYAPDDAGARWRTGYKPANRTLGTTGLDLDRWVWQRKRASWKHPMQIIAPSRWLADCARESALFQDWPVSVIPNVLDTSLYQPLDRTFCRQALGLPLEGRIILVGAIGGSRDPRKGYDLLLDALVHLGARYSRGDLQCVVFGESAPTVMPSIPFTVRWMGHLNDDFTLALLYNAADVMVVPSRQENLPQTATEPQACGCPVVAFDCTGFPDAVEHLQTGYLAKAYDTVELAAGIDWVLTDDARREQLGRQARKRALRLWSAEVLVPQYVQAYEQAIARSTGV